MKTTINIKLTNLITWTTALYNSMKLWAMLCRALQDTWVMVESSDKTWSTGEEHGKPFQYSCLENRINSIKTFRHLNLNISHCWRAALRTLTSLMTTPIPSAEGAKGSQMQVFRSKIQGRGFTKRVKGLQDICWTINTIQCSHGLNVCFPAFICWDLIPNVMVLGGEAFGR